MRNNVNVLNRMKHLKCITVYTYSETIVFNNTKNQDKQMVDYCGGDDYIIIYFSDNTVTRFNNISYSITQYIQEEE